MGDTDPTPINAPKATAAGLAKEIIREVPVMKEFDADTLLKVGEALLVAYRKGWEECRDFIKSLNPPPPVAPKKGFLG
jgi:hypothetical protein